MIKRFSSRKPLVDTSHPRKRERKRVQSQNLVSSFGSDRLIGQLNKPPLFLFVTVPVGPLPSLLKKPRYLFSFVLVLESPGRLLLTTGSLPRPDLSQKYFWTFSLKRYMVNFSVFLGISVYFSEMSC